MPISANLKPHGERNKRRWAMIPKQIINEAIRHYGVNNQLIVSLEELAELQKEICKFLRGENNRDHLIEELVDTQIMIEQLIEIFEISRDEIFVNRMRKLKRLEGRIENERKKYKTNEEIVRRLSISEEASQGT